jgi:hypothetical protein
MVAWLLIYIGVIALCGSALTLAILGGQHRDRHWADRIGLIGAVGCGGVAIVLLWISMLGVKPMRAVVLCIGVASLVALVLLRRRFARIDRSRRRPLRGGDVLTLLALALIGVQLACAAAMALLPAFEIDAIAIWGLKAKVLYFQSLAPRPEYFTDLSLSFTHLDYPLLVPSLWAGAYAILGAPHDGMGKTALLLPLVALVAAMYGAARGALDRPRAALLTALAMGLPVVGAFAGRGIADPTFALFLFLSAKSLMDWLRHGRPCDALLAGAGAGLAAMTKLEGWPLIVSIGAVLTIAIVIRLIRGQRRRESLIAWITCFLAYIVIVGPWLIWSRNLPHAHENYQGRLRPETIVAGLHRLPELMTAAWRELRLWSYLAPLVMLLITAAIGWRAFKQLDVIGGWIVLVVQLLAYVAAFLVTPWDVSVLAGYSLHRLLFHVAPLAMLLAARHWEVIRMPAREASASSSSSAPSPRRPALD